MEIQTETQITKSPSKLGAEFERSAEALERRSQTVLTGNVFSPNYGRDESDTQRGNLALENVRKALEMGYKYVLLVSHRAEEDDEFVAEMKRKLAGVSMPEENLKVYKKDIVGYGASRWLVMDRAVRDFLPRVVSLQEAEKDLTPHIDALTKPLFKGEAGIVTMRRSSLKSLPDEQRRGEAIQDSVIHGMLADAGIPCGDRPEDILNGTRFILNEPVETKYGRKVNPMDLFTKMNYVYDEGSAEKVETVFKYNIDHYSSRVYFPLVLAREMGIKVEEVEVPYVHDKNQTLLEEGDPKFLEKRINQAKDIVAQHFDLVASILKYKEEGKWPEVLFDALDHDTPLVIGHYEMREWEIEGGKLLKRN